MAFFFFQAEDGIRDDLVTGVQTCALPISDQPTIARKIGVLNEVGLGYLKLGHPSTILSDGEAQRVKLAGELGKLKRGKHNLYILDEPTTGLHFADIDRLLQSLNRLVDNGHSVVVIEHNLDVIKTADHVIDLGPEGGHKGGQLIACGTPEEIAACQASYTGKFLAKLLGKKRRDGSLPLSSSSLRVVSQCRGNCRNSESPTA